MYLWDLTEWEAGRLGHRKPISRALYSNITSEAWGELPSTLIVHSYDTGTRASRWIRVSTQPKMVKVASRLLTKIGHGEWAQASSFDKRCNQATKLDDYELDLGPLSQHFTLLSGAYCLRNRVVSKVSIQRSVHATTYIYSLATKYSDKDIVLTKYLLRR